MPEDLHSPTGIARIDVSEDLLSHLRPPVASHESHEGPSGDGSLVPAKKAGKSQREKFREGCSEVNGG